MKRRRKQGTPRTAALRELALAGQWDELRRRLEERLARAPRDEEARSELERLDQGLPLRLLESPLARQRRLDKEMQEELEAELTLYRDRPELPEGWGRDLLMKRRKRVAFIRSNLGQRMEPALAEASHLYLCALDERLERLRGKHRLRRGLVLALLPLVLLGLMGSALDHRATLAGNKLQQALSERDPAKVEAALKAANSGINRLFNGDIATLVQQAQHWQARVEQERRELEGTLAALEAGEGSISSLPLARRVVIERALRHHGKALPDIAARWQGLCGREQAQLREQRNNLATRFSAPLPPLPPLSGRLSDDETLLNQQLHELEALAAECRAAHELFGLDEALAAPMQQRIEELHLLQADIAELRRTTALLPTARSYARYREVLATNAPRRYTPAQRLMEIREQLPDEARLSELMQDHGRKLPPGMLEAARHALLEGGPSFTPTFHANARQVYLMEELFTATALHKVLYEMSAATLPSYIVEERPVVDEESVSFHPSPLSPGFTIDTPRQVTWRNPRAVYIRRIDATAIIAETGIRREDFFRCANLPQLLDRLLRLEDENCPVLARAYAFHRLLGVMAAHEWPTMLGLAYAPTLRADARSFARLVKETDLPLTAGCWLQMSPERTRAAEAFKNWFYARRHHHYAREIARNFASLVQVHPRYVGFIDEAGQAQLYCSVKPGTLLWYMAEGCLTTSPQGEAPENPTPFSPVFIVEKD